MDAPRQLISGTRTEVLTGLLNPTHRNARALLLHFNSQEQPILNVSQMAQQLADLIAGNDNFTPEEKQSALVWVKHFNALSTHENPLVLPKFVAAFNIKSIVPVQRRVEDNLMALEQLKPVVAKHRELLKAVLIPFNLDAEKFLNDCEFKYSLMIETKEKVNIVIRMFEEILSCIDTREEENLKKVTDNLKACQDLLQGVSENWQRKTGSINMSLKELTDAITSLFKKYHGHSQNIQSIAKQLSQENSVLVGIIEKLKKATSEVK
jgi:predicted  nucleic acid-binding Zn-ribbon protein